MTITTVSSLSSLASTVAAASTNDIVQLDAGTYNNGSTISLTTSASKVFVRAKNSHRAIITGSPISFSSPGIHFLNFDLQFNLSSGNYSVINTGANNCRISHCKIGTQVDPLLTQNADKTYSFTASSPLKWSQYGKVIPTTEVGTIRSFI